jgi:hypothetical protein
MDNQDYLPRILFSPDGSLSMVRSLKQILILIEENVPECDEAIASIDDLHTMLKAIK